MRLEYNPDGRIPTVRLIEIVALLGGLIAVLLYIHETGTTWLPLLSRSPSVEYTVAAALAIASCLYVLWQRGGPLAREIWSRTSSPHTDAVTVIQIVAERRTIRDPQPGFGESHYQLNPWAEYLFLVEFPNGRRRICLMQDDFLRRFRVGDVALVTRRGGWILAMEPLARRENVSPDEGPI